MANSVFSAPPTFYMCSLQLPPTIIKQVDRYRKHCLWSGSDINRTGSCIAVWETACRTKGGLGTINMKNQNVALLNKFLDKFYNHDYNCALCNNSCEETSMHLLFERPLSSACWQSISINWNLTLQPLDVIIEARTALDATFSGKWSSQRVGSRNGVIFSNASFNLNVWKDKFRKELGVVCIKTKQNVKGPLNLWIVSLL